MTNHDTTSRTLVQAYRMPQWQRLIDSIHAAQASKGYPGRQFGKGEMEWFGATLIGKPAVRPASANCEFAAHWVERQSYEHSDGSESVRYVLKSVYGDNLAEVHTISEWPMTKSGYAASVNITPEKDAKVAAEFVKRALHQIGEVTR